MAFTFYWRVALAFSRAGVEYPGMTYHLNPRFELIADCELVCHCSHCGPVPVPRFQIRRWLEAGHPVLLPGLDGWIVLLP